MSMRVTATLREVDGQVLAECEEYDEQAEGTTAAGALAALRVALFERLFRPEAVAPPPRTDDTDIEIVVVAATLDSGDHGPNGPGEAT